MFWNLFNLSYERNLEEALVFYFFYIILGYYFAGLIFYCASLFFFNHNLTMTDNCFCLIAFIPFFYYSFLAITIVLKKKLIDRRSIYLVIYTITITFVIPFILAVCIGLRHGLIGTFMDTLYPNLLFGCIPVAILTTKEDHSLKKEIQEMEQEKLEHERWVENQLQKERMIVRKNEILKKLKDNEDDEK